MVHRGREVARAFPIAFLILMAFPARGGDEAPPSSRAVKLSYDVRLPPLPEGTREIQIWVPVPQSDAHQVVTDLRVEAPLPHSFTSEPEYGNLTLYLEDESPLRQEIGVLLEAKIVRRLQTVVPEPRGASPDPVLVRGSASVERLLGPDELVPVDGVIAEISQRVTKGLPSDMEKARAIYDYVTGTMRYDKSGEGWGKGDAVRACNVRTGNCTDFHALFIGLCRAAGIPATFEIGFSIPDNSESGVIPGYHCWAEFFAEGIGWVPVDCSEAVKNTGRLSFYFGSLDPNRVLFTVGRDVRVPGAKGIPPLNYFIDPVVLVDGKPLGGVVRQIRFSNL